MEQRTSAFFAVFAVIGSIFLLIIVIPLIGLLAHPAPRDVLADLRDPEVLSALGLTFLCATLSTAAALVLCTPLAYLLARRRFPGKTAVRALVNLPVVVPHPVAGIALHLVLARQALVGSLLDRSFGVALVGSLPAVVLAMFFVSSPFVVNAARDAFLAVDPRLENVARSLGASPAYAFRTVTLPLAARGIATGAIMAWARATSEFGSLMIVAYFPKTATVLIWDRFSTGGMRAAAPVATLLLLIALGVLVLLHFVTRSASAGQGDDRR